MTSPVFGFLTQKGGGAKTTTSVNFAHWLAASYPDKNVALLDTCNSHHAVNWEEGRKNNALDPLFYVDYMAVPHLIGRRIKELQEKFDYVVIDGKPDIDVSMQAAASLCDVIVIPVKPGKPDVDSAAATASYLLGAPTKSNLKTVFLLTAWKSQTSNGRSMVEALHAVNAAVQLPIIGAVIEDRTVWPSSISVGSTVFEQEPNGPAATEANAAFNEIMEHLHHD